MNDRLGLIEANLCLSLIKRRLKVCRNQRKYKNYSPIDDA